MVTNACKSSDRTAKDVEKPIQYQILTVDSRRSSLRLEVWRLLVKIVRSGSGGGSSERNSNNIFTKRAIHASVLLET